MNSSQQTTEVKLKSKIIPFNNQREEIEQEIKFEQNLGTQHPDYVLRINGYVCQENQFTITYEYTEKCVPILEYAKSQSDPEKQQICHQLYNISCWMTNYSIVHGNLKPSNLFYYNGKVLLSDFDNKGRKFIENIFHDNEDQQGYSQRQFCQQEFLEIIKNYQDDPYNLQQELKKAYYQMQQKQNLYQIDFWALGVIILEILGPKFLTNKLIDNYYGMNKENLSKALMFIKENLNLTQIHQQLEYLLNFKIETIKLNQLNSNEQELFSFQRCLQAEYICVDNNKKSHLEQIQIPSPLYEGNKSNELQRPLKHSQCNLDHSGQKFNYRDSEISESKLQIIYLNNQNSEKDQKMSADISFLKNYVSLKSLKVQDQQTLSTVLQFFKQFLQPCMQFKTKNENILKKIQCQKGTIWIKKQHSQVKYIGGLINSINGVIPHGFGYLIFSQTLMMLGIFTNEKLLWGWSIEEKSYLKINKYIYFYKGEFQNEQICGEGKLKIYQIFYKYGREQFLLKEEQKGEFKNGKLDGQGKRIVYQNKGNPYEDEGIFKEGKYKYLKKTQIYQEKQFLS